MNDMPHSIGEVTKLTWTRGYITVHLSNGDEFQAPSTFRQHHWDLGDGVALWREDGKVAKLIVNGLEWRRQA